MDGGHFLGGLAIVAPASMWTFVVVRFRLKGALDFVLDHERHFFPLQHRCFFVLAQTSVQELAPA